MAKNNMLLGYARGKVGDLVFQRRKGEQITKARNRNPNNPRTWAQQMQRVRMYAPVAFYKLATENFFRFAFENKKPNETDYNAFVRENLNAFQGPYFTKTQVQRGYPALAPYKVSNGSLGNVEYTFVNSTNKVGISIDLGTGTISAQTIAGISQALIQNGMQNGDMMTVIWVRTNATPVNTDDNGFFLGRTTFEYKQFTVDVSDTRTVTEAHGEDWTLVDRSEDGENFSLDVRFQREVREREALMYTVIVTRRNNGKIYASNTNLEMNKTASDYFKNFSSTEQLMRAAESYGATISALDPKFAKTSSEENSGGGNEGSGGGGDLRMTTEQTAFNCLPSRGSKSIQGITSYPVREDCPNCGCHAGEPEPQPCEPDKCPCEQETSSARRSSRKTSQSNATE